ncbi:MAG: hypothetical protein KKE16_06120 [Firmicutes bacterium]|nr:hypothetical protein [Bacillota bacterium]
MANKKPFIFSQIETYRKQLEIKHLQTNNRFVVGIVLFMMISYLVYMLVSGYAFIETIPLMVGFLVVLILNIANRAYGKEHNEFYQLNQYITTVGLFSLSIAIIFLFQSPAMVIGLFLAYTVSAFYQDLKVLLLSNIILLFTVIMIIVHYPQFLGLESAALDSRIGISFFFVAFMIILSLSSYLIIKQKSFFFNQISSSKESEFRNLDLIIDLKERIGETKESDDLYFESLSNFLAAFCKKIKSENIFEEKVEILKLLNKDISFEEILTKYPEYTAEDLSRMEDLLISKHHKLRKAAMKISYMKGLVVEKREIFSETQFKSFNHQSDSMEIKIIAFVLFYTALKKGFALLPGLDEKSIFEALNDSDFYYYMDPRIVKIYHDNSEVFDAIVKDAFKKKVKK